MALILITPPAVAPVSLDEIKAHARIDFDDDDALLADLITTATARLDGRDGALGRCLITQTWRLALPGFRTEICLPLPPCQEVTAVSYLDTAGVTQTLDPADYEVTGLGSVKGATIRPAYGTSWPSTRATPEAVFITFSAGYGDDASDVPVTLRTAIKMDAAHLYEHRESVMATDYGKPTPQGYDDLILDHRTWVF